MESKANYTLVGLIVILLTSSLLIVSLWLSIGFDRQSYRVYGVYMHEAVSGLSDDSLVKYNGVKVGYVSGITLNPKNPQEVYVQLHIRTDIPVTTSTEATLISQGITGTTYLGLSAKGPGLTPLTAKPGEDCPIIPYKQSFFNQLETSLNEISTSIRGVLNKENEAHLSQILAHIASVTDMIAKNNAHLDQSLQELPLLIKSFQTTVHRFNQMAGDVSLAGKQVNITMKAGRRTIDNINQQAIPPAVSVLHRLDDVTRNLEILSRELNNNPTVLLRGHAPAEPGPGE